MVLWYTYNACGVLESIKMTNLKKKTIDLGQRNLETAITINLSKSGLPPKP